LTPVSRAKHAENRGSVNNYPISYSPSVGSPVSGSETPILIESSALRRNSVFQTPPILSPFSQYAPPNEKPIEVFISYEGQKQDPKQDCIGYIEIELSSSLERLRKQIEDEGVLASSTLTNLRFVFHRAPVALLQESKRSVRDCMIMVDSLPYIFIRKAPSFSTTATSSPTSPEN